MEPTIRQYKSQDHSAILKLHHEAFGVGHRYEGSGKSDNNLQDIEGVYLGGGGDFLVVTVDDQIVAMAGLLKVSDTLALVKRNRVAVDFQSRGFGGMLLARLEERAKELGFTELQLETRVSNVRACRFYERHGYREFNRVDKAGHECVFFRKGLASATRPYDDS